jgi:2-oxoglutarate ferredoxin oxidoreductase subunit alpha
LLDLPFETMVADLKRVFAEKSLEANIALAEKGYEFLKNANYRHSKSIRPHSQTEAMELLDGNSACGLGMVRAGLDYYVAYPMTPASSILHYLAKNQRDFNIKTIQPENEIAAINMAIGIAYAGKRAATGTSGGGFALMEEAFSLAGMAETPIVVALSQRPAPATGVPTYTSQADLRFAIHAGHGEFPRLVIAPGDAQESFKAGADAMNLAWKHQLPVIVLLDKHLSDSQVSGVLPESSVSKREAKMYDGKPEDFLRYRITEDGVSPMLFPGVAGATVRATSYEHDEEGLAVEDKEPIIASRDKRVAKAEGLRKDSLNYETLKTYGDPTAKDAILFWGSTKGAVLEASKYFNKPTRLIQVLWLEPFDAGRVLAALNGVERIIDVECNAGAQLAGLLRERTGISATHALLRYDGRPFDPLELAEKINSLIA